MGASALAGEGVTYQLAGSFLQSFNLLAGMVLQNEGKAGGSLFWISQEIGLTPSSMDTWSIHCFSYNIYIYICYRIDLFEYAFVLRSHGTWTMAASPEMATKEVIWHPGIMYAAHQALPQQR